MKALITICLLITAICSYGQDNTQDVKPTLTKAEKAELLKSLETLTDGIKKMSEENTIFSKEHLAELRDAAAFVNDNSKVKRTFSKTIVTNHDGNTKSTVTYKVNLDDADTMKELLALDISESDSLRGTFREFIVALKESPEIKELVEALKELESKTSKND